MRIYSSGDMNSNMTGTEFRHQSSRHCGNMLSINAADRASAAIVAADFLDSLPKSITNNPHHHGEIQALRTLIKRCV
jgi:hypothetical protein